MRRSVAYLLVASVKLGDESGHQVVELTAAGALNRAEVYAGGRHLLTYCQQNCPSGTASTYFAHTDWIGDERARTNSSGTLVEKCANFAFGDGLTCIEQNGPTADLSPLHFTGKPRDTETNLDYFGARYDSSTMGRFMTPDPFMNSGHPTNPQTWNRYTYVLNNPLRYTDPTGLYTWGTCLFSSDLCESYRQRFRDSPVCSKKSCDSTRSIFKRTSSESNTQIDAVEVVCCYFAS